MEKLSFWCKMGLHAYKQTKIEKVTRYVTDTHYKCAKCNKKVKTRENTYNGAMV